MQAGEHTVSMTAAAVDWSHLVDGVRTRDETAMEQLYALFGRGIRSYLYRQVGSQEVDDKFHDIFLVVVQAIQRGELREPERLMGFVRTIAQRRVAAHIESAVQTRKKDISLDVGIPVYDDALTPEESTINQENIDLMTNTLRRLAVRDREILTRFYLQEQTQEQICVEMDLTDTQFRLLKSRAKARFGEKARSRLKDKPFSGIFARGFSAVRH